MITVKEAAQMALQYFEDIFKESEYKYVTLEEIVLSEDGKHWLVTIGYSDLTPDMPRILARQRQYKIFKLNSANGELMGMLIRRE